MVSLQKAVSVTIIRARRSLSPSEGASKGTRDDDENEDNDEVQLGFIDNHSNRLFLDHDWNNWDGGKVGGYPVTYSHNMF